MTPAEFDITELVQGDGEVNGERSSPLSTQLLSEHRASEHLLVVAAPRALATRMHIAQVAAECDGELVAACSTCQVDALASSQRLSVRSVCQRGAPLGQTQPEIWDPTVAVVCFKPPYTTPRSPGRAPAEP